MDCIRQYIVAAMATTLMVYGAGALACGDDSDVALEAPEQVAQSTTAATPATDPELVEIFGKQTALAVVDEAVSTDYSGNPRCRRVVPEQ